MPTRIQSIQPDSIAEEIGIRQEDILVSINGHDIQDELDYLFYQAGEKITLKIGSKEKTFTHFFEKDIDEDIGLILYPMKVRKCACNCIFCFVDQIHPQARPSLKVKDDDFRLSFFHGNFITLSNLTDKDYTRIIEQHLSPLYISVHSTNDILRQRIMRYKKEISVMEKLIFFAENGISMHTQIVLVPGWNDGEELYRTVYDLASLYPSVQSIGIVPVGLTKFRENLVKISKVNPSKATELIEQSEQWREGFRKKYSSGIVSLADEFFLLAGMSVPKAVYYEGFPQIENGVGMVREFLEQWETYSLDLFQKHKDKRVLFVTGISFYPIFKNCIEKFNVQYHQQWKVIGVKNEFLGTDVTVAGLLAGQDVRNAVTSHDYDEIILPDEMFNVDGMTLDNMNVDEIVKP